ncbi:MAG TPA: SH3 domain-containing protein [Saprospiraceae bacterium]|nr:SH3 domain-containing protein [Saprospiraceae bacterium]
MKNLLCTLLLAGLMNQGWSQNPTLVPKDEAFLDTSLVTFVDRLLEAIDKRDQRFLYSVLDFDVSGIRGEASGLSDFKQEWDADNDSSMVWLIMKRAINLGGVFLHDENDLTGRYQFVFPYVYDLPLDIEDDYYNIGVITGKNVNLRDGPDTASPIKSKLTYDVVWYLDGDQYGKTRSGANPFGDPEWYQIETYDRQQRGWVNWRYIYSPMDYRMFLFKDGKGNWKISAFLAGD